jgi:hypothetical protein
MEVAKMSRITKILILSLVVLLAAATVVYAQTTDSPGSQSPGVSGDDNTSYNQMFDYCFGGSNLTPEQRDQLEQDMRDHMGNGNWDQMWQWMEQNGWGNHMGADNPMNSGNWDQMWQWMDEHMGDGAWQNHMGYGYRNNGSTDDTGSPAPDTSGSTGNTGADSSYMGTGYGPGAHMGSGGYYGGSDTTSAGYTGSGTAGIGSTSGDGFGGSGAGHMGYGGGTGSGTHGGMMR